MTPDILGAWIGRYTYRWMWLDFGQGNYGRIDLRSMRPDIVIGTAETPDFWFYGNKIGPEFDGFALEGPLLEKVVDAWRDHGVVGIHILLKEAIHNWGRCMSENVTREEYTLTMTSRALMSALGMPTADNEGRDLTRPISELINIAIEEILRARRAIRELQDAKLVDKHVIDSLKLEIQKYRAGDLSF
jgi:hypothetical protein